MKKKSAKKAENKKTVRTTKASSKKPDAEAVKTTSSSTGKKRGRLEKVQLSTTEKKTKKSVVATVATPDKKAPAKRRKKLNTLDDITPVYASMEESFATTTRRNKSGSIERTDRFKNIDEGLIPFKWTGTYAKKTNVTIKDAIVLCQKCYYNFATFRNVIDLMTEFSTSNVYFRGGNKKSRKFFEAFFKKINIWAFQEKFFREYYRSGNVFIYRIDAKFKESDLKKISQTFGARTLSDKLPVRYMILNPADVTMSGTISFSQGRYFKVLTEYELQRLKHPKTEEDEQVLKSFSPEIRKQIKDNQIATLDLPLGEDKFSAIFYKKQDYEPFSVPMGYPVLDDINWKAEMKKMDMAIARTMQQAILLVTMGAEPEKGGINQKNLTAMQKIFDNESVGRVLIADYTTKAEFVIPKIGELLDAKKYEVVNEDIKQGLNNILIGDEKFSNQNIKVKVFIERLKQAREVFINEFLYPEIRRIGKTLGFRNLPTPRFEDIDIKDAVQFNRIYTRLVELGVLTPEEGISAIETGRLPDHEESEESQGKYKPLKDQGLYEPLTGGPFTQEKMQSKNIQSTEKINTQNLRSAEKLNTQKVDTAPTKTATPSANKNGSNQKKKAPKENGRPPGSGTPQSTKNVKPIGSPGYGFSVDKIKENMILAQKLESEVQSKLKEKHDIKRISKKQKEVVEQISNLIVANEDPKNWLNSVEKYCDSPMDQNPEKVTEINNLAHEHQLDHYLASILYASKCNVKHEEN